MKNLILFFSLLSTFLFVFVSSTQSQNYPQLRWKILAREYDTPPILINNTVYYGSCFEDGDGEIAAVDIHSGRLKWQVDLPEDGYFSNLIYHDSTLYLGSGDAVFAINANTGELKWKTKKGPKRFLSPIIMDDEIIFGSYADSLYAFEIKTGVEKWKYGKNGCKGIVEDFRVINGILYIAFEHYQSIFCAVDFASKQEKWSYIFNTKRGGLQFTLIEKYIFCAQWDSKDIITLDIQTGFERWRFRTSANGPSILGYHNGIVYVFDRAGSLYAIDAETGKERRHHHLSNIGQCNATYDNGIIHLGLAGGKVVAVDANSGKQIWEFDGKPLSSKSGVGFVSISQNVMLFNINSVIYAVDLKPEPGLEKVERQPYLFSHANILHPLDVPFFEKHIQCDANPEGKPFATASSTLSPYQSIQYDVSQLQDGSFQTAWVEGTDEYGIGEFLEFTFDRTNDNKATYTITGIWIINGYRKSDKLWEANSRIKTFKMYLNNEPYALIELLDTAQLQIVGLGRIDVAPCKKMTIKLEIMDIYKGNQYKDTAISELLFNIENGN